MKCDLLQLREILTDLARGGTIVVQSLKPFILVRDAIGKHRIRQEKQNLSHGVQIAKFMFDAGSFHRLDPNRVTVPVPETSEIGVETLFLPVGDQGPVVHLDRRVTRNHSDRVIGHGWFVTIPERRRTRRDSRIRKKCRSSTPRGPRRTRKVPHAAQQVWRTGRKSFCPDGTSAHFSQGCKVFRRLSNEAHSRAVFIIGTVTSARENHDRKFEN